VEALGRGDARHLHRAAQIRRLKSDPLSAPSIRATVTCDEIGALIEAVRSTDAIFLGVLATTRRLLDSGEFVELALEPAAGLNAQFAFITLEGRTEAPALGLVREFLSGLAEAEKA
jgi:hypothetical protein